MQTHTTAPADPAMISNVDLVDRLQDAVELVNCIIMAAHSLNRDPMNAISRVAQYAVDAIKAVQDELEEAQS